MFTEEAFRFGRKKIRSLQISIYKPTNESMALTITGTDVKAIVIIPNKLMLKLERAAALGSFTSKTAVAIAEELPPSVTPLVT